MTTISTDRVNFSFNTTIGKEYLHLRQLSLAAGTSKAICIPYLTNYANAAHLKNSSTPTKILDIGCFNGDVLSMITQSNDNNVKLYGLDYNTDIIERGKAIHKNIEFIQADLVNDDLTALNGQFDIVFTINTLHEIFSFHGFKGQGRFDHSLATTSVKQSLGKINSFIKPGGKLLIFDGVNPDNANKKIIFSTRTAKFDKNLQQFIVEYSLYRDKLIFKKIRKHTYETTLFAFTKFITKLRFLDTESWKLEREETYQYFSQQEFIAQLSAIGFTIEAICILTPNVGTWQNAVDFDTTQNPFPAEHILISATKS